jgi:hypothetical protein
LGKERKSVWVLISIFSHSVLQEQQVEKMGEELGRWNNKDGIILEHDGVFLECFGAIN